MTKLNYQAPTTPSPDAWTPWTSRLVIACAFIIVCLATIVHFATDSALGVLSLILVDGGVALLWVLAAAGVGGWIARPWLRDVHWALRLTTAAALGMGLFSLVLLGLGLVGYLNSVTVWTMFFGGLVLSALMFVPQLLKEGLPPQVLSAAHVGGGVEWTWMPLAVNLGMLLVAASIVPGLLWKPEDPHPYDVLSYHLQVPREWYELGRIAPLSHNVFSYFPMGMEVHFLGAMHLMRGPWAGMYVAQFINVWMALVMTIGVYGAARTLRPGGSRLLASAAAVLAAGVPWVLMLSSVTYAETGLMVFASLSAAWLLHFLAKGRFSAAVIAGVLAGFACGVKYPAVPMVVIAAVIACMVALLPLPVPARRGKGSAASRAHARKPPAAVAQDSAVGSLAAEAVPRSRVVLGCIAYGIVAVAVFSPWLVRNLAWSGNPVFPLAMGAFGSGHFTPEQVERFERAHDTPPAQAALGPRWERLGEVVFWHWQFGYVLVPLAFVALLTSVHQRQMVMLLTFLLIGLVVWFCFTHLLGRFLAYMIPIAAIAIALHHRQLIAAIIATTLAFIVAVATWVNLHEDLLAAADAGRAGLFGAEDLSFMVPEELDAIRGGEQSVALVGDAGAFFYQIPMSRLRYRTVFDVDGTAGSVWDAWGAKDADLLVVHPAELRRLHDTYAHIPAAPPALAQRNLPLVIRTTQEGAR